MINTRKNYNIKYSNMLKHYIRKNINYIYIFMIWKSTERFRIFPTIKIAQLKIIKNFFFKYNLHTCDFTVIFSHKNIVNKSGRYT